MSRFLKWVYQSFLPGRPATRRQARLQSFRPRLESLEGRLVPAQLSYGGGPLLAHVKVENVFYGSAWSDCGGPLTVLQSQLNNFAGCITDSVYMDNLQEYSEPGYRIGRGAFLGGAINFTNLQANTTISDGDIQNILNGMIDSQRVPPPDGNTLYVVYTPPNVHVSGQNINAVDLSFDSTIFGDFGYHSAYRKGGFLWFGGTPVFYAVVPHQTGNAVVTDFGTPATPLTPLDQATVVTSAEMVDAVIDPNNGDGWLERGSPARLEASDLRDGCGPLNGFSVHDEWTNRRTSSANELFNFGTPNIASFQMTSAGVVYEIDADARLWRRDNSGTWALYGDADDMQVAIAPNGRVYELTTQGQLKYTDGHGWVFYDAYVESFAVAPSGRVYDLNSRGQLRYTDGNGWQNYDAYIESFAVTPGGRVYDLNSRGQLRYTDGNGWQVYDAYIESFAVASSGRVYDLNSRGQLRYTDGNGWQNYDAYVISFGLANGGGTVWALNSRGQLRFTTGNGWQVFTVGVKWFGLAYGGTWVYELTDWGTLPQTDSNGRQGTSSAVAGEIQSAVVTYSGLRLCALTTGGFLIDNFGDCTRAEFNVQSFGLAYDGKGLYTLHSDGALYEDVGYGAQLVATQVKSFGLADGGKTLYRLQIGGSLYVDNGYGTQLVAPGVQSFGLADGGKTLYRLQVDGNLYVDNGYGTIQLDSGVQSFGLAYGGKGLYTLHADGTLCEDVGYGRQLVDTSVRSFALADAGVTLYVLNTNSTLKRDDGSDGLQVLDAGVQSLAVAFDGLRILELKANGDLNTFSNSVSGTHGLVKQSLDTGVTWFALAPGGYHADILETSGKLWQVNLDPLTLSHISSIGGFWWLPLDSNVQMAWLDSQNGGYSLDAVETNGTFRQFAA
jgi:hypothetical protein